MLLKSGADVNATKEVQTKTIVKKTS